MIPANESFLDIFVKSKSISSTISSLNTNNTLVLSNTSTSSSNDLASTISNVPFELALLNTGNFLQLSVSILAKSSAEST